MMLKVEANCSQPTVGTLVSLVQGTTNTEIQDHRPAGRRSQHFEKRAWQKDIPLDVVLGVHRFSIRPSHHLAYTARSGACQTNLKILYPVPGLLLRIHSLRVPIVRDQVV